MELEMKRCVVLFGGLLLSCLPAAAAPFAYVSNERSGSVTIIDTATDKPVLELKVGGRARGIQMSADGKTLYVARCGLQRQTKSPLDAILAIDVAARRVTAKYEAGSDPER